MTRVSNNSRFIVVKPSPGRATRGQVMLSGATMPCALGRGGVRSRKREGDGATPLGIWPLRSVYYRSDRTRRPVCDVPVSAIQPDAGWCDAVQDRNYNRPVRHPYPASAERLWRDDHLYDLILVIGHNDRPRQRGCGSAIFMHLARPGYKPTEGCIALSQRDMRRVLQRVGPSTRLVITR